MDDWSKFIGALERIGAAFKVAAEVRQEDFLLVPPALHDPQGSVYGARREVSADTKASAAYHPYAPPAASLEVAKPQPVQERKRFLQITKAEDAFFTKVPMAATENLLWKVGLRQVGEWHVKLVEGGNPLPMVSFDDYDEAKAFVTSLLAAVNADLAEDEHEYASVGEVPC